MKIGVLFISQTGNTEKLAKEIYHAIPCKEKDIQRLTKDTDVNFADTYFIGFWTNRGTCNLEVMDYISELHGKNVALFGTCGMGNDPEYYKQIENRVVAMIPEDNIYLGTFLCQGKMPINVRNRYEEMLKSGENDDMVLYMIHNFDRALLHPNQEDFEEASIFVNHVMEKLELCECLYRVEE